MLADISASSRTRRTRRAPFRAQLPYAVGLDGLRAIAVLAVLLYHARDISGLPAVLRPSSGFLGVEVFFVISGYLITALLLAGHASAGVIELRAFWARRARRLLPALFLLLIGVVAATAALGEPLASLRAELAAAVLYVSNWLLIAGDSSYFESVGRPSLLQHLWSLAVEEQFYLLWPAIVFVGLRWFGPRTLAVFSVAAAAASTAATWLLFDQLDPYGDVTAIYYRTDARAAGLLIGAAVAFVWRPWLAAAPSVLDRRLVRGTLDGLGLAALVAVVWVQYTFSDQVVDWDAQRRLYQGGFLFTSIPTAILVGALVMPGSWLGRALGNPLLRWVGTRSYGLYLWHWPVYQLTRPRVDVEIDGWTALAVRLAVTVLLAELSYRLVERPIRERRFAPPFAGRPRWPSRKAVLVTATNAVAVAAVALVTLTLTATDRGDAAATVAAPEPSATAERATDGSPPAAATPTEVVAALLSRPPAPLAAADRPVTRPPLVATPIEVPPVDSPSGPAVIERARPATATPTTPPSPRNARVGAASSVSSVVEPPSSATPTVTSPPSEATPATEAGSIGEAAVTIVGDSVVLGAVTELVRIGDGVAVFGEVGRQWSQVAPTLRTLAEDGRLGDTVVIQLGNNGTLTAKLFDEAMAILEDVDRVIFVNVRVPKPWEADVNAAIAAGVARHAPRAQLADWQVASNEHPEFFVADGVHLKPAGSAALRALIEASLAAEPPRTAP